MTVKITVLWNLIRCSLVQRCQRFGDTCCLLFRVSSATLKMETTHSSEPLVYIYQTTRHHIEKTINCYVRLIFNFTSVIPEAMAHEVGRNSFELPWC
jgi:hypothetical protein